MYNFADLLMPIAIAIIMFGIGLTLKFKDFSRVFTHPKAILTGLCCQLILLPILAFIIVYFWPIDPAYKVGIVLIASVPGGTASNLVTHMLKGRVALSVSLTSFNSFAIIFTIPMFVSLALLVFLGKDTEISLSFSDTFNDILFTVVLPVIAGILVNEYTPDKFTDKLRQPSRIILPLLLIAIVAYAMFSGNGGNAKTILADYHLVFPLLLLNILGMLGGFYISRMLGIKHSGNFTIAIEMGLQNSALAIFVASQILENDEMEMIAVLYGTFSFFTTFLFAWMLKKYFKPKRVS
ncbi:bile acid:sodium symporter family protein [Marivirga sp. S37H4]|uniref:Bile acid:sodium symporter family protein n=1 Tax=Marivirga aurantiaca TaxID=2802615 RepID=A0A935C8H5_9BACT|nr:bile acid:sodium symporter [Marivirga aurantiaca]MBK6265616.1 bile acid:sodium symporter family protein [Marivirga aurantiaca]